MSSWGALARGCGTLYLRELGVHRQPGLGISKGMGSGRLSKLEVQAEEEREETGEGTVDQRLLRLSAKWEVCREMSPRGGEQKCLRGYRGP